VANKKLLISSVVIFYLAQTHTYCSVSIGPNLLPLPGGISRFVLPNKYLLISSVFSFSFVHSHTLFNISELSKYAAQCQAALPVLSVHNNYLLISSVLSFPLYNSHTFCSITEVPEIAAKCHAVLHKISVLITFSYSPLLLVSL